MYGQPDSAFTLNQCNQDGETLVRMRIYGLMALTFFTLSCIQDSAFASDRSYRRVVLLLWDTSQSMVMRKAGPLADENDLHRLKKYVSDLLFHGLSLPILEPDYQECQESFLQNPNALLDHETLLIAHRFHVKLEQPEGLYLPPSENRELELWQYLPKPAVSKSAGYVHLETELVRPLIDAITNTEDRGIISSRLEELFLVIVSDNITEATIPPGNLPQKYLDFYYTRLQPELSNHRIFTLGVQCNTRNQSIHRILVNVYQMSKQSYLPPVAVTSAPSADTPTPIPQPTAIPTPAGTPTPWSVVLEIPESGLGLIVQGDRVVSESFGVNVQEVPDLQVPAPVIQAELLDDSGNVVSTGMLIYPDPQMLPAKTYADFEPIRGDQWPSKARWIVQNQSQVRSVTPSEATIYKKESLGLAIWILVFLALGSAFLFFVFRSTREPKEEEETIDESGGSKGQYHQAKITLTLDPSFGGGHTLEFYLAPGESYQFGLPIQGHRWFEEVDCLPYKIALEKRWLKSPKLLFEEPAGLDWDESEGKRIVSKIEIPLSSSVESRLIELKGREDTRTWDLQISVQWLSDSNE